MFVGFIWDSSWNQHMNWLELDQEPIQTGSRSRQGQTLDLCPSSPTCRSGSRDESQNSFVLSLEKCVKWFAGQAQVDLSHMNMVFYGGISRTPLRLGWFVKNPIAEVSWKNRLRPAFLSKESHGCKSWLTDGVKMSKWKLSKTKAPQSWSHLFPSLCPFFSLFPEHRWHRHISRVLQRRRGPGGVQLRARRWARSV